MIVRNNLKKIRMQEFMMAPGEFAKFLDIDIKTYSNWERERSKPPLDRALRISEKLKRDVREIWYLE
ncbi:helix-turn-helix domain-containing protein [Clostridium botulinum]|uniref:Helix-turn-helix domain-containing protein n=1 Tax=Clostridium botulinum TaxID=1491 RepID=A0A6B4ZVT7_CLOBO|nr:helix-turn-helix domain-containing protein [Clostridium botulinum]KEI83380.1 XRE family transcriptional regulator [Clostridium botulinum B2 331]KEI93974.1 XRE family transcriptional regulator [Clostridium botulinum B2 275]NFA91049.1 helix-turn-helix domain-containing protein [Clostridium botulinum]NFB21239.1 helix-turn-helix domain-containing protein [Clostridium botulinum]NFD76921.1 helix-turn-helix domain-containing protein [Clostridium botulinum]